MNKKNHLFSLLNELQGLNEMKVCESPGWVTWTWHLEIFHFHFINQLIEDKSCLSDQKNREYFSYIPKETKESERLCVYCPK